MQSSLEAHAAPARYGVSGESLVRSLAGNLQRQCPVQEHGRVGWEVVVQVQFFVLQKRPLEQLALEVQAAPESGLVSSQRRPDIIFKPAQWPGLQFTYRYRRCRRHHRLHHQCFQCAGRACLLEPQGCSRSLQSSLPANSLRRHRELRRDPRRRYTTRRSDRGHCRR